MSSIAKRSFASGELAPALYARVDQSRYATGAKTVRNFLVMRHGGLSNRSGSKFIGEVKTSSKRVRLIPFVFNTDQTYVIEMGDLYFRVIHNGAYVSDSTVSITGATQANPIVITSAAHGFSNGQEVAIYGVLGMTELNGRNFKVANVAANTFQLTYMDGSVVNSTGFGAYVSGGSAARVYTVVAPYAEADLQDIVFVQSADTITITHSSYAPRNLTRSSHTSWAITAITFAPTTSTPTGLANSGAAGNNHAYKVTAISSTTGEESLPTAASETNTDGSVATPVGLSWNAVSGALEYNVYRKLNDVFGLIGVAGTNQFNDKGYTIDTSLTPPRSRNPFDNSGSDYPSVCTYAQQRLLLGATPTKSETIEGSQIGYYKNFTKSSPLQDDDSITFSMAGRQANKIKAILDLGKLLIFTSGGEFVAQGDADGILKPTQINLKQFSYNGSGSVQPLVVGGNGLYIQARGSIVRDIGFDFQVDGYRGSDLTVFSAHLFDGYTVTDWAYQQIPHSIVWCVRDDGTLLGLTYVQEQQLIGWHRHDFENGTVENVCTIPDGNEDSVYLVIKRTIDGVTKRYVEKLTTRQIDAVEDSIFMDSALSYDGRNTGSTTMTLSGGTTWAYDETITITASSASFLSSDVGNQIHVTGSDGTVIRFTLNAFTSTTVMTGKPHKTVPVSMRSVASATWAKAVDQVTGLWHLEGEDVSVFGDGFVVASPNNDSYDVLTVTNGAITLDKCYGVIHVGIPITSDIETLNIDTAQGETVADKYKLINRLSVFLDESRGLFCGTEEPSGDDPLENLIELKLRNEEFYDDPVELKTGVAEVAISANWNDNGRIFIRQVDPLPASVLAVVPSGLVPFGG